MTSNQTLLEQTTLAMSLMEPKLFKEHVDVPAYIFTMKHHQIIWNAMRAIHEQRLIIDLVSVMNHIKSEGLAHAFKVHGGAAVYLSDLTNTTANVSHRSYEDNIFYLKKNYIQTKALILTDRVRKNIDEHDAVPNEVYRNALEEINEVSDMMLPPEKTDELEHQIDNLVSKTREIIDGKVQPFTPSGYHQLDKLINGLTPTDVICIAARPGMGKTAFVLSLARKLVKANVPTGFISLEMSSSQLLSRFVAIETRINAQHIKNATQMTETERYRFFEEMEKMKSLPFYINDTPRLTIEGIRSWVKRIVKLYKIKVLLIDYIQLIAGSANVKGATREQEVSHISREIKIIAKEFNLTIIELAQLSRAVETRGGTKIPQLSDLRESGAIEQDADIIAFIYRPEYYNINTDDQGNDLSRVMKLIIAKNRHGPLDSIILYFEKLTTEVLDSRIKKTEIKHTEIDDPIYNEPNDEPF